MTKEFIKLVVEERAWRPVPVRTVPWRAAVGLASPPGGSGRLDLPRGVAGRLSGAKDSWQSGPVRFTGGRRWTGAPFWSILHGLAGSRPRAGVTVFWITGMGDGIQASTIRL